MKKIAIVINTSWNIVNFRLNLIRAMQQHGYEVVAIAPQDEYSSKIEREGIEFVPVNMQSSGANPFNELGVIYDLYKTYKTVKPDVVLHYTIKPNIYGTMAAKMAGIPAINNVSGLGTVFLNNTLDSKIARRLYRIAFKFPNKVFFQNDDDLGLFLRFNVVRKEITEVIPGSGIDIHKFVPNGQVHNDTFNFLVISRLLYDKGICEYVDAARSLKNRGLKVKFQMLGAADPGHRRGIPKETLTEWCKEGVVEYLGTTDNVLSFIHKADCIVLPSYREGTPRTLLEAASAGKPIVTTNVPGCNNVVVDNVNGFLCKEKSAEDLADKMLKMYSLTREERLAMGKNSREIAVTRFDEKIVINSYLKAVEELINKKK